MKSISDYLIQRLYAHGIRHVFGVPGDYALGFYRDLDRSRLTVVNTCDEQGAGFAADAYARVHGLGAVCITYCVGGFKVANTTAQAFAEKSPVVVISGSPGVRERTRNPLLHHKVRDFDIQLKVFEQLTVASAVIDDAQTACGEINRVLAAATRYKRPVYIELPRDMISAPITPTRSASSEAEPPDPAMLEEALAETQAMIDAARKPVIIAGVELHRFGLQDALLRLVEKTNIPVAATLLSKSVIGELHPRYLGVYAGAMGRKDVQHYVESSDCLILLGTFMSDINLGIFTAHLEPGRSIYVTSERTSVRHHTYPGLTLDGFLHGLLRTGLRRRKAGPSPHPKPPAPFRPVRGKRMTVRRLFQRLNAFLDDDTVVIADTGDAMFAAADMTIHSQTEFLSPAYYTSVGYAVPASIGVQLANPRLRPLVLVGDGAFQMTGLELSTAARFGLTPIVLVLNNAGYGTERPMMDGAFNDLLPWTYSLIPQMLGTGVGFDVATEDQLEAALQAARRQTDTFCLLDIHLDAHDRSPALQRLTEALAKRVRARQ
ncbi:MAG: alpha-keto acid decarboxylase family protein [Kiritimatiellae bacterium]|nr:alpha-keto acid decarboxylase family protein [Kiritimatiellia bacterium]